MTRLPAVRSGQVPILGQAWLPTPREDEQLDWFVRVLPKERAMSGAGIACSTFLPRDHSWILSVAHDGDESSIDGRVPVATMRSLWLALMGRAAGPIPVLYWSGWGLWNSIDRQIAGAIVHDHFEDHFAYRLSGPFPDGLLGDPWNPPYYSPTYWWSPDHSWFVHTGIDSVSTVVSFREEEPFRKALVRIPTAVAARPNDRF